MTDLLDLMVPAPKPTWRGRMALAHKASLPAQEGDLQWLADDYRDHRRGGKWFRFDAHDRIWRCIDPFNKTGINARTDQPPAVDRYGRPAGSAAQ